MTVYMISRGREAYDYNSRECLSFELDEEYGYYATYEDARRFCDEQDEKRFRAKYQSYLEHHKELERERKRKASPNPNKDKEREYQLLLEAGLRKPRPTYEPTEPDPYEQWLEKSKKTAKSWDYDWQSWWDVETIEPAGP